MLRGLTISFSTLFAVILISCGSQTQVPSTASALDPGTFRVQVVGKFDQLYDGLVESPDGDHADHPLYMWGTQVVTGSGGFAVTIAIPDGTSPGEYTMCSMPLYEARQCDIGVLYERREDGLPTAATRHDPASISIESVDPLSGVFAFEASLPDGADTVRGAFKESQTEE